MSASAVSRGSPALLPTLAPSLASPSLACAVGLVRACDQPHPHSLTAHRSFLVAEPLVILLVFLTPICFASELCGFICGESVNNVVALVVEIFARIIRG